MHANWTKKDWIRHCLILLLGLIVMAFGVAFSIEGKSGNLPDFQRPLRHQHVFAADSGNRNHRHALYTDRPADPDPA